MKIKFNHWLFKFMRNTRGIVLYPYVLFREAPEDTPTWLYRHELEHVYQVEKEGWLKFYLRYLYRNYKHGYWNNPYEVEARAVQHEGLTSYEKAAWDLAVERHNKGD